MSEEVDFTSDVPSSASLASDASSSASLTSYIADAGPTPQLEAGNNSTDVALLLEAIPAE